MHQFTLSALAVATLAAGCLHQAEPPVGSLLVQLQNDTDAPQAAVLQILEPHGGSAVYERVFQLSPSERVLADEIRLVNGAYGLRVESGTHARQAGIDLAGPSDQYRFIILDDAIAFQAASV